jgi:hypothetical protein
MAYFNIITPAVQPYGMGIFNYRSNNSISKQPGGILFNYSVLGEHESYVAGLISMPASPRFRGAAGLRAGSLRIIKKQ